MGWFIVAVGALLFVIALRTLLVGIRVLESRERRVWWTDDPWN
jgi:hypothetical protein